MTPLLTSTAWRAEYGSANFQVCLKHIFPRRLTPMCTLVRKTHWRSAQGMIHPFGDTVPAGPAVAREKYLRLSVHLLFRFCSEPTDVYLRGLMGRHCPSRNVQAEGDA